MKLELVTSSLGIGTELHIASAEFRRINSEIGYSDYGNLIFALDAYVITNRCVNQIKRRDMEEAFRHIKKAGTIVLTTKTDGNINWCEVYAITEGELIPVITSKDGCKFSINYSSKTIRDMKHSQIESEADLNE